jgi:hypothetical protein
MGGNCCCGLVYVFVGVAMITTCFLCDTILKEISEKKLNELYESVNTKNTRSISDLLSYLGYLNGVEAVVTLHFFTFVEPVVLNTTQRPDS